MRILVIFLAHTFLAGATAWSQQASEEKTQRVVDQGLSEGVSNPATRVEPRIEAMKQAESRSIHYESETQLPEAAIAKTGEFTGSKSSGLSTSEIALSITVLVFKLAIVMIVAWLRVNRAINGDASFKLVGLMIVVGSSLFLISAGWSQQQITPVVGLLGTSLGFIFGKNMADEQLGKTKDSSESKSST